MYGVPMEDGYTFRIPAGSHMARLPRPHSYYDEERECWMIRVIFFEPSKAKGHLIVKVSLDKQERMWRLVPETEFIKE